MNGVSGYDAPGYVALVEGLQNRDSRTLEALASFGPLDAIVSRQVDPGHQIQAFVAAYPGAVNDGAWDGHVVFRVPASSFAEPPLGPALPIVRITASGNVDNAELAHVPRRRDLGGRATRAGVCRDVPGVTSRAARARYAIRHCFAHGAIRQASPNRH